MQELDVKYRAKSKEGKCCYGLLFYNESGEICIQFKNKGRFFYVPILKETIGEFTGFKTKTGRLIYGGDILGDKVEVDGELILSKHTVYFDERLGSWMLDCSLNQDRSLSYSLFAELEEYDYKVIGNFFDNPELLKK